MNHLPHPRLGELRRYVQGELWRTSKQQIIISRICTHTLGMRIILCELNGSRQRLLGFICEVEVHGEGEKRTEVGDDDSLPGLPFYQPFLVVV